MKIVIDGSKIDSIETLHKKLSEELSFPEWYGNNLDALYDVLTDIKEDTCLVIENSDKLMANLNEYGEKLVALLEDVVSENDSFDFLLEKKQFFIKKMYKKYRDKIMNVILKK